MGFFSSSYFAASTVGGATPTPPDQGQAIVNVFCLTGAGIARVGAVVEHRAGGTNQAGYGLLGSWIQSDATGTDGVAHCYIHAGALGNEPWQFRIDYGFPERLPAGFVTNGETVTAPFSLRGKAQT